METERNIIRDGGFPGGSDSKESVCNVGDLGSFPGLGRSPGGGHGNPLQCSCQENPIDRGAWRATVHVVEKSRTRLSYFTTLNWSSDADSQLIGKVPDAGID